MVHPASHQIPRVRCYSGYCRLHTNFDYGTFTLFGWASQLILLSVFLRYTVLYPDGIATFGLASFPFARRYLENLVWFLFLRLLRCFSSAGLPSLNYGFIQWCQASTPDGFPHSEICGSIPICDSPQLIAACHVLLRLLMPRHSPCALFSLTNLFWIMSLLGLIVITRFFHFAFLIF